jgi:hypothetical protein
MLRFGKVVGQWSIPAFIAAILLMAGGSVATAQEIVDSKGVFVGLIYGSVLTAIGAGDIGGQGGALRVPDGQWVVFPISVPGLVVAGISLKKAAAPVPNTLLYYRSSNCAGTPYLYAGSLPTIAIVVNADDATGTAASGVLYYPALPFRSIPFFSEGFYDAHIFRCQAITGSIFTGAVNSVKLSFTPPFSIK